MRRTLLGLTAAVALFGAVASQAQSAKTNSLSVNVQLTGRGIIGISPTSCSFVGGTGSANTPICQFTATTIPAGQAVTFAITGGTDAAKFVITSGDVDLRRGRTNVAPHPVQTAVRRGLRWQRDGPKMRFIADGICATKWGL